MRGVKVEILGTHHKVFRVGCFQNQQTRRLEYPKRLGNQYFQILERNMFSNMKTGNDRLTFIRKTLQSA